MIDRQVFRTQSKTARNATTEFLDFSSLGQVRNVVLLGDPGAGKTHLFQAAARASGGRYMTVRQFLNVPPDWGTETVFIDALDERRSGRGDDNVVDRVVQKLYQSSPARVRISSRAQDWLGESDLDAFGPYFDQHGGVTIVSLRDLSTPGRLSVLESHGVTNGRDFLREANTRGLSDFLGNPQNLIMLAAVVRHGKWPITRRDLFSEATQSWLKEHNQAHSDRNDFSLTDLRWAAGALCALRLISDVDGFSLGTEAVDGTYPRVSDIPFLERSLALAALHCRVFSAIPGVLAVDYAHRTTAEFLAAEWIAGQLAKGLSFRRVIALLGCDGEPATELRGLHAWLGVFAHRFAEQLIEADPYGFLSYGDPASISPGLRVSLLSALSKLSAVDPWFRSSQEGQRAEHLAGMCGPEMTEPYRAILTTSPPDRAMRQIVLGALASGSPHPDLLDDLNRIFADKDAPSVEREGAVAALLKLGKAGAEAIMVTYSGLGWDASSLQTRADAIAAGYGEVFSAKDVVALVNTIDEVDEKIVGRVYLWPISEAMSETDIRVVLDCARLSIVDDHLDSHLNGNEPKASHLLSAMFVKIMRSDESIEAASLWRWLRKVTDARASRSSFGMIQKALVHRKALVLDALEYGVRSFDDVSKERPLFMLLQRMTAGAVHNAELLDIFIRCLETSATGAGNARVMYESALALLLGLESVRPATVEYLCSIGESDELRDIRDSKLVCELSDWRIKSAQHSNAQRAKEEAELQGRRGSFAQHEAEIRAGKALGWIGWLARVYLGQIHHLETSISPSSRLSLMIGHEFVASALAGLVAISDRPDMPEPGQIARQLREDDFPLWWFGIVAAVTEAHTNHKELYDRLPDRVLGAALAFDVVHPTFLRDGNTLRKIEYPWKQEIFTARYPLACEVFVQVIRCDLEAQRQYISGLNALLEWDVFKEDRLAITMALLSEFRAVPEDELRRMLKIVSNDAASQDDFIVLARSRIAGSSEDASIPPAWLTAAFLTRPDEFAHAFLDLLAGETPFVWYLAEALADPTTGVQVRALAPALLGRIVGIVATRYPNAPYPFGSWSGNRHPWDAAEFVRKLINLLASHSSDEAYSALRTLCENSALESYRENILHATAEQATRRRDAEYEQPGWLRTVTSLNNGAPASRADFHALLLDTLCDAADRIANVNTNAYKRFWNENSSGVPTLPKPEESGRDVLIDILRERLSPMGIHIEPEGRMVANKRADIVALFENFIIPIEIKRNYHADVWVAIEDQLARQYVRDPGAAGYGIYAVFWFGTAGSQQMPLPPGASRPACASEMAALLTESLLEDRRPHIGIIVIDVTGQPPASGNV
jgi:hypothetical protein